MCRSKPTTEGCTVFSRRFSRMAMNQLGRTRVVSGKCNCGESDRGVVANSVAEALYDRRCTVKSQLFHEGIRFVTESLLWALSDPWDYDSQPQIELQHTSGGPDGRPNRVANFVTDSKSYGASCARICARMSLFLLADCEQGSDRQKPRFPLVNRLFFEAKRSPSKSMISES